MQWSVSESVSISLYSFKLSCVRVAGASPSAQRHHEGLAEALDSPTACPSGSAMGWAVEAMAVGAEGRNPEDVINPSPLRMMPSLPTHTPNRTGAHSNFPVL